MEAINWNKIRIFVEGAGDKVFIRDFLMLFVDSAVTRKDVEELIIICDGFNQIHKRKNLFDQTNPEGKREGGKNIVIFDADYKGREQYHGFAEKLAYLEEKKQELAIDFEAFLFPDNANDGTLETILESCIHQEHKGIMDCWKDFETCVKTKGDYTLPACKSKIYVYLECLYGQTNTDKDKIKDRNRDFTLADKWILDAENNTYLAKLKQFLDEQLQPFNI